MPVRELKQRLKVSTVEYTCRATGGPRRGIEKNNTRARLPHHLIEERGGQARAWALSAVRQSRSERDERPHQRKLHTVLLAGESGKRRTTHAEGTCHKEVTRQNISARRAPEPILAALKDPAGSGLLILETGFRAGGGPFHCGGSWEKNSENAWYSGEDIRKRCCLCPATDQASFGAQGGSSGRETSRTRARRGRSKAETICRYNVANLSPRPWGKHTKKTRNLGVRGTQWGEAKVILGHETAGDYSLYGLAIARINAWWSCRVKKKHVRAKRSASENEHRPKSGAHGLQGKP